ncbi:DUF6173 family protein [Fictibacillus sp. 7GRE50]|uniref:DUF6173 family protein n=1 Tax=Fictibacillus sp. 7GRE50 TaxID=2745878 RepID=UPI001E50128F|nr:DUF6173 family protein [Fictibacillus sp. 7GRE50]
MNLKGMDLSSIIPKVPTYDIEKDFKFSNPNHASEFYTRLVEMINDFDEQLDQSHEVGMRLVSFGQTVQFHVEDLGYYNPSLIKFIGRTEDGNPIELIQHVSQISFLLMSVKRLNPDEPKRKIGFTTEEE